MLVVLFFIVILGDAFVCPPDCGRLRCHQDWFYIRESVQEVSLPVVKPVNFSGGDRVGIRVSIPPVVFWAAYSGVGHQRLKSDGIVFVNELVGAV